MIVASLRCPRLANARLVPTIEGRLLQIEVQAKLQHPAPVAQVGWNPVGNWLAASTVDSLVLLWRPDLTGQWQLVNRIAGTPPAPGADMEC